MTSSRSPLEPRASASPKTSQNDSSVGGRVCGSARWDESEERLRVQPDGQRDPAWLADRVQESWGATGVLRQCPEMDAHGSCLEEQHDKRGEQTRSVAGRAVFREAIGNGEWGSNIGNEGHDSLWTR